MKRKVLFLIGLLIFTFPFYSREFYRFKDLYSIKQYDEYIEENREDLIQKSKQKNISIIQNGTFTAAGDPFTGFGGDHKVSKEKHYIGRVSIPKLNLSIPLYDTTNKNLLDIGATVLDGTSIPLGEETSHTVVTAHRGLPTKELFTNIPKLDVGDVFVLDVLGKEQAYKITGDEVVLPHQTEKIVMEEGKNLATLVTCTPYMINSHRLLIYGEKIDLDDALKQNLKIKKIISILVKVLLFLFFLLFLYYLYKKIDKGEKEG